MSNKSEGRLDRSPLMTYAIACVFLDEIDARDLQPARVRDRAGISERSWTDYMNGKTRGVPVEKWAAIARALGIRTGSVIDAAEDRVDALSETDAELLLGLNGRAAMMVMRDKGRRAAADSEDPPDAVEGRNRRSA